jgi:hypothetical protein
MRNFLSILCKDFFLATLSRNEQGHSHPPIQLSLQPVSLGIKQPGLEADHSPLTTAEFKNAWNYTSSIARAFLV